MSIRWVFIPTRRTLDFNFLVESQNVAMPIGFLERGDFVLDVIRTGWYFDRNVGCFILFALSFVNVAVSALADKAKASLHQHISSKSPSLPLTGVNLHSDPTPISGTTTVAVAIVFIRHPAHLQILIFNSFDTLWVQQSTRQWTK